MLRGQAYQALTTSADLSGFDPGFLEKAALLEVRHGEVLDVMLASVPTAAEEVPRSRKRAKSSPK